MGVCHGVALRKGGDHLTTLDALIAVVRLLAALMSLWFGIHKLYRWLKRKKQQKTHRPRLTAMGGFFAD